MRVAILRGLVTGFLFLCSAGMSGCGTSEDNIEPAVTRYKLKNMGLVLERFTFDEVAGFHTLRDFLDEAEKGRLNVGPYPHYYENDGWRRPFLWDVKLARDEAVIHITSSGANGIPEEGAGDDFVLEVRIFRNGLTDMHIKEPSQ
jgi:hypothetical protein